MIRLGTRASALAQWQANWTKSQLEQLGCDVELIFITTEGDVNQGSFGQIGGQGLFTKRIQYALLEDEIDLAVHSLKDLPTDTIPGLSVAAVPPRENAGDAFVSSKAIDLESLAAGAMVGTGSLRRQAQLLHYRSDIEVREVRGNVDTRLRKLDDGEYDGLILAEAGLLRLELHDRIQQIIPKEIMLPAVGQGALGWETRSDDDSTIEIVNRLNCEISFAAVSAERAMLRELRGGCLAPVGAWGRVEGDELVLEAVVLSADGTQRIANRNSANLDSALQLGKDVAHALIEQGAADLIASSRGGG